MRQYSCKEIFFGRQSEKEVGKQHIRKENSFLCSGQKSGAEPGRDLRREIEKKNRNNFYIAYTVSLSQFLR